MNEAPAPEPEAAKHPVDQTLPPVKLFGAGLQHVAAMYAGVVARPWSSASASACPPPTSPS